MTILRYFLIALGILGAVFTMPAPSMLFTGGGMLFGVIFLGFLGLIWFAWGMGKSKEAPGAAQSSQMAPLDSR